MTPSSDQSSPTQPNRPYSWPWWAWALTLVSYVVLGYFLKSVVLNWIVGPLYPLLVMYLLPAGVRWLRGAVGRVPSPMTPDEIPA